MTNRLHSLDFLRAFALLMGVLLHVLMLFLEPFDDSEPRLGASIIFIWIHTWRMPLFMLLAGFFTALSLQKRDVGNYALNRLIRLGAPILILWAIIPAIDEGSSDIFKLPELISWLLYDVPFTLRLDHLWFLYYLLIFYGVLLLLKRISPKALNFITDYELSFFPHFRFVATDTDITFSNEQTNRRYLWRYSNHIRRSETWLNVIHGIVLFDWDADTK